MAFLYILVLWPDIQKAMSYEVTTFAFPYQIQLFKS